MPFCPSRLVRFAGMIGGGRQGSSLYLLAGGSLYLVGCGPLYLVAATVRKERGTERCGRPNGALICPRLREGTATVVALCTSLPVALCPSLPAAFWRQNGGKSLAGMPGAPSLPSFPLYSVISWLPDRLLTYERQGGEGEEGAVGGTESYPRRPPPPRRRQRL